MKKLIYLLTIIVLLLSGVNVFASTNNNIVDFSRKGRITVTLINEEVNYVEGANIKIYKLATAYSNNSNLDFDYHEDLKLCENAIKENKFDNETVECIYSSSVESKELTTNNKGKAIFEDLDLGLYLIEQTNKVDGYSKIDPFLMYIPVNENNGWIYEVDAEPKVDIIRLFDLTVKKEWNVISGSNTPNEVVIELLKDNEVIEEMIEKQVDSIEKEEKPNDIEENNIKHEDLIETPPEIKEETTESKKEEIIEIKKEELITETE